MRDPELQIAPDGYRLAPEFGERVCAWVNGTMKCFGSYKKIVKCYTRIPHLLFNFISSIPVTLDSRLLSLMHYYYGVWEELSQ